MRKNKRFTNSLYILIFTNDLKIKKNHIIIPEIFNNNITILSFNLYKSIFPYINKSPSLNNFGLKTHLF